MKSYVYIVLLLTLFSCGNGEKPTAYEESEPAPTATLAPQPVTEPGQRTPPRDLAANEPEDEGENADAISAIRAEYSRIENLLSADKLRVVRKEIPCQQQDGQLNLFRYYEGDEVVMIKTVTGIGHDFVTSRIYLDGGQPIFEYEEDENFMGRPNADGSMGTVSDMKETRIYVKDAEIIRKLKKSFTERSWENDPSSAEVPNQSVKSAIGTQYPRASSIPQMIAGNVGC